MCGANNIPFPKNGPSSCARLGVFHGWNTPPLATVQPVVSSHATCLYTRILCNILKYITSHCTTVALAAWAAFLISAVSEGCLDMFLVYKFFYQSCKNRMGPDRAGQLMPGQNVFGPKNLSPPNNFGLKISLEPNLFWIKEISTKSFLSRLFTFHRSSYNVVAPRFSAWMKIWQVPAYKMEPRSDT